MTPTFRFCKHTTPKGYVVSAEVSHNDIYTEWLPMRNFGFCQYEAVEFMREAHKLEAKRIIELVKSFNIDRPVKRYGKLGNFKPIKLEQCNLP